MTATAIIPKKEWKSTANTMLSIVSVGGVADYYINNPEKRYAGKLFIKRTLAQYGVENSDQLKESLEWRLSKGIRYEFEQIYRGLCLQAETERIRKIEAETNPHVKHRLAVANYYLRRMPSGGVGAYDFAIVAMHSLGGVGVGWLTDAEAGAYVEKAVRLTREHYSNWHDYCFGFTVGLEFFNSADPSSFSYVEDGMRRLRRLLNFKDQPVCKGEVFLV
ncbi:MAG: DUF1266 domain-containing protein [Paenibacillus macerans]|uniref:DUF1266 domain-containing protein n=1 Tax=Paenibacillus macerans TaxID=44252 RepID=UPI0022E660EC|nr:DUF1266 domain-containing protein [Paenibacillus macerans]MDU7475284.1 DUF1266 domain-containing protein [Paenibacillus macerans]MEC0140288.1 DUF1266 domain-containing protein [Paenibacillus macerans]